MFFSMLLLVFIGTKGIQVYMNQLALDLIRSLQVGRLNEL